MKILEIEWDELEWRTIGQWPIVLRGGLIVLFCGLIVFVGKELFIEDEWALYQRLKSERFQKQKEFANTSDYANHLETYRLQVQEVKQALEKAVQQLPCQSEEADLLEIISEQASLRGLEFRGIKPEPTVIKEFYREQSIEFSLTGGFHGLGEFIAELANMPRIVTIHNFSLKREKQSAQLEILLTARIYWSLGGWENNANK